MRKLALLFFVCFFLNVYSLKLNVPEKVLEGSSFTAIVKIEESNFDEIRVSLNNSDVFTGSVSGISLSYDLDASVIASYFADTQKNELILFFNPLEEGSYTIEVTILQDGSVLSQAEKPLVVFSPLERSEGRQLEQSIENLQKELESVKGSTSGISEKITNLEESINSLRDTLSSLSSSVEEMQNMMSQTTSGYESLQKSFNELNNQVSASEVSLKKLSLTLQDLNSSLQSIFARVDNLEERQTKVTTGFVTLGQGLAVASTIIIATFAILLFFRSRKAVRESLFEEQGDEKGETDESEQIVSALLEEEKPVHRGRWAYKGETKEEKEERRFSLGDLIRRNP